MDVRKALRKVYAISWLSWLELSNWTKPPIFIAYTLVRPLFTLLMYAYIYVAFVAASGRLSPEVAFYMISGISFYNYIGNGLYGVVWVIHEEREHYRLLKYNYLALPDLQFYLASRGVIHYGIGLMLSFVTYPLGLWLLGYDPLRLRPDPLILLANLLVGYVWCTSLGVALAATSLFSAEWGPLISESMGGLLFLVGSVLFPAERLPYWLRPVVDALPMREWMEVTRHALNAGYRVDVIGLLGSESLKAVIYAVASTAFFKAIDRLVRAKGYLEATTEH